MSTRLVILFAVSVIGIIAVVNLAAALAFSRSVNTPAQLAGILIVTSLVTLIAIVLAAAFRMIGLRGGGGVVARELGGVLVPQDTADPQLRRLRNVVEEIAIASGTPVPEIYLLPHENGINAFAAGWSTSDAAVAVTRGALERLNRAELQGVIAHEFSHVVNGDMRLNIRLMGLLFGILFLAIIGRTLTQTGIIAGSGGRRDGDRNQGNPLAILGIALLVAGFIGVLVGRLIKAAVSRQREYLADASAVQFTRQTSGIVGALAKIAGLESGSKLRNPKSEEVGHMLFGAGGASQLFATHPPLLERIKVLDPTFDAGKLDQLSREWAAHPPQGLAEDAQLGFAPSAPAALPAHDSTIPVTESEVVAGIGAAASTSFERAEQLIAQIPPQFLDRARDAGTVVPLILGLLLSDNEEARTVQHALIAGQYGRDLADAAWNQANDLTGLHPLLRLPLAELAFPAQRHRSAAERSTVVSQVMSLIQADGRITPYEYCLSRLVVSELNESTQPQSGWRTDRRRLDQSPQAVAILLAVLAQAGSDDQAAAEHAFRSGLDRVLPGAGYPYAPPAQGVLALENAWPSLVGMPPEDNQRLVGGVVATIADDGKTTLTEMELLRTMCAILHCPLPL